MNLVHCLLLVGEHTCSNLQYHYYFYIAFSPETLVGGRSTSPATDSTVSARDMITSPARDRSTSPIRSYESGALSFRIAMNSPAKDAGREAETVRGRNTASVRDNAVGR